MGSGYPASHPSGPMGERENMNGKDYVTEAMDLVRGLISEIKKAKTLDGDTLVEGVAKACEGLAHIKNKATLRTKTGANRAFTVHEAALNLEEAWEDAQGRNGNAELKERMEDFILASTALASALKERTVIMT